MRIVGSIAGIAALWLVSACSSDGSGVGGDGSSGSGSSSGGSTSSASDPGATSVVSGQATADGTTSVEPATSDGMDSVGFITAGTDEGPGEPAPNGELCQSDVDCESGHCLTLDGPAGGLGGVCSECTEDAHCEVGTCDFSIDIGYGFCTDGSAGVECDGDEGCAEGLVCVPVFDAGGFSPTRCSECSPDVPCPEGQGCALVLDGGLFEAYWGCVDAGTVPLGEGCPVVGGVGDGTTCASGECGVLSVFDGALEIGVCSECDADDDCPMGQMCNEPTFSMGMLGPGVCG